MTCCFLIAAFYACRCADTKLRNLYSYYHPRTLTANIRRRRGSKVAINLPLFFDENTPRPHIDPTIPWDRKVFREDPGTLIFAPTSYAPLHLTCNAANMIHRGKSGSCEAGSRIYGRDGLRHGMLLPTAHLPSMQRRRLAKIVRRVCARRAYHGELYTASVDTYPDRLAVVSVDGRKSVIPRIHRRRGLSMGRYLGIGG